MGEFLGFVTSQMVDGHNADVRALSDQWRSANDHVQELIATEPQAADGVTIGEIPNELSALASRVLADPLFRRAFEIVPTRLGVVELDRLVVYQKRINLDFVARLQETIGRAPNAEVVFRTCLPYEHVVPAIRVMRVAQNAFTFISPSNDVRVVDVALLQPNQIQGFEPHGVMAGGIGLLVGFGINYLQTIHAEGRLILGNGSHRAYALRELGITHVPCVVQEVTRRDELEVLGIQELTASPDRFLKDPRPPLLKDYFDERLRSVIPVPRQDRQVKIAFAVEALDVPAT